MRGLRPERRAKTAEHSRNYRADGRGVASAKAWAERNKEKRKAHSALNNAVRDGKITKGPCSVCGTTIRVHGHHPDYLKPLEVVWLCHLHHEDLHHRQCA